MYAEDTAPPCVGLTPVPRACWCGSGRPLEPDGALAFMISGDGCGGTNPVLCRKDTVLIGFDVPLGAVAGIPLFAHPDHARYLARDRFVIDALDDARSDTFSLEASYGGRFVLRELPSVSPGTL